LTETKRQHAKIKHTIAEHLIPETAEFGEVFCARDTGAVWYATRSGVVVNLTDVLNGVVAHTPPRHGKDAPPAKDGAKGERGERGADGKDGRDGKDGVGQVGAVGPQGRTGRDCVCHTEIAEQRLAAVENSSRDARSDNVSLKAQLAIVSATVQGLIDMNKQSGEYIEWLRERVARRAKQ
jgi:hypothetical protein